MCHEYSRLSFRAWSRHGPRMLAYLWYRATTCFYLCPVPECFHIDMNLKYACTKNDCSKSSAKKHEDIASVACLVLKRRAFCLTGNSSEEKSNAQAVVLVRVVEDLHHERLGHRRSRNLCSTNSTATTTVTKSSSSSSSKTKTKYGGRKNGEALFLQSATRQPRRLSARGKI